MSTIGVYKFTQSLFNGLIRCGGIGILLNSFFNTPDDSLPDKGAKPDEDPAAVDVEGCAEEVGAEEEAMRTSSSSSISFSAFSEEDVGWWIVDVEADGLGRGAFLKDEMRETAGWDSNWA